MFLANGTMRNDFENETDCKAWSYLQQVLAARNTGKNVHTVQSAVVFKRFRATNPVFPTPHPWRPRCFFFSIAHLVLLSPAFSFSLFAVKKKEHSTEPSLVK